MSSMHYFTVFLAGVLAGVVICGIYIASLKATIKFLELYIHERIDRAWHRPKNRVLTSKSDSSTPSRGC